MSDITIKSQSVGDWFVSLEMRTRYDRTSYFVVLYYLGGLHLSNVYALENKKGALACYRRYLKKAETER